MALGLYRSRLQLGLIMIGHSGTKGYTVGATGLRSGFTAHKPGQTQQLVTMTTLPLLPASPRNTYRACNITESCQSSCTDTCSLRNDKLNHVFSVYLRTN